VRLIRYIITNAAFGICLWVGIVHGISGAANFGLLLAWWSICISAFLTNKDIIAEMRKKGRSVPLWIDQIFDASVLLFMVWHAWWITGIGYLFHMVMVAAAHRKAFGEQQPSNTILDGSPRGEQKSSRTP
jgi:hypothetical protein